MFLKKFKKIKLKRHLEQRLVNSKCAINVGYYTVGVIITFYLFIVYYLSLCARL